MGIQVDVLLFARARELAGRDRLALVLESGATLRDAAQAIGEQVPPLRVYLGHCRMAVDREFASMDLQLENRAEIAIIPPVSGGRA